LKHRESLGILLHFPPGFRWNNLRSLLAVAFPPALIGWSVAIFLPRIRGIQLVATTKPRSDLRSAEGDSAAAQGYNRRRGDSGSPEATLGRRRGDVGISSLGLGRRGKVLTCTFAGFRLEGDGTLWRGDRVIHLPPQELAALRLLMAHAGQIVSPLQLKHTLWGDVHVTGDSVPKCLSSLRSRLQPEDCIQTVYKRGYRFTAEVIRLNAAPVEALPRLAILPFSTMHFVPKHLGSAIAEETIVRLTNARSPVLSVLARDSVFTLVNRGFTALQIGEALKADFVLTGSLRAFSSQFRLRAEMIRVEDGTQIWVEDILVDQNRIAGLESELVQRLAWRLGVRIPASGALAPEWELEASGRRATARNSEENGLSISASAGQDEEKTTLQRREAYEFFLRGRHEWQTLHRHRMQDGLQQLLRAIEVDPTLISAKIDLVHLCVAQTFFGFMPASIAAGHIHRTAKSISDIPLLAEGILPALGWVHFHYDRDLCAAVEAFSRCAHMPHGPWTTRIRTMFLLSRGSYQEAIELLQGAIQQDPFAPWLQSRLAWALHLDGQASESLRQIQITLNLFPDHEFTCLYGSLILAHNGEAERAVQIAKELAQRVPFFDPAIAAHAYTLACAGFTGEARSTLERLQWLSRERFLIRSFTPAVHVALGDFDAAIDELQAANESRCPWFFQMLADPRLKALHGNTKFERLRALLPSMEEEAAQKTSASK
jgi:DNA-binding winged helix-turn-helix (wHTH) protein/tetratricopeptide (TPR) repeat protein